MERRPQGYLGHGHVTLGSDILAIVKTLRFPEITLGKDLSRKLSSLDPHGWYPIAMLLELTEELHNRSGPLAMRQMGRSMFEASHEQRVRAAAHSARDICYGINDMYHFANRGTEIGGWKVLSFQPGRAELWKNTPLNCMLEEGLLLEALSMVKVPASVSQMKCFRRGAECCQFRIVSNIMDKRWTG